MDTRTNIAETTRQPRPGRRDRHRRRRAGRVATALAGAFAIAVVAAGPSAAAPPVVYDEGAFDDTYTVPAEAFPCGVEVTFHEVGTYRFTAFVDGDGAVVREMGHIGGTTTIKSAYGQVVNRWREHARLDSETGTVAWSGNSFNIHGSGGGRVLINTSGRWVEDATGDLVFVAGPQEHPDDHLEELCAALLP